MEFTDRLTRRQKTVCARLFRRLTFLSLVIAVWGCATSGVNMLPTLSEDVPLEPGQGIVVARVINASAYPLPFNQLTIAPENYNESSDIKLDRLLASLPALGGSTVFAAAVTEGNYALDSIRAYHTVYDGWYSRWVTSNAQFGTFPVRAGEVTDLGTIIYYRKVSGDRYNDTLERLPEFDGGEVLSKYFPFQRYQPDSILTWVDDGREDERYTAYSSMVQNPIEYTARYLAPDGMFYVLGRLGSILSRDVEGGWELDAVDTNLDLNTIAKNNRGDLIVGGEEGRLFLKRAGGEWQDISLESNFRVVELRFHDDNSVDMFAHTSDELYAYRADLQDSELRWYELNRFSSNGGWSKNPEPDTATTSSGAPASPERVVNVEFLDHGLDQYFMVYTTSSRGASPFFKTSDHLYRYDASGWDFTPVEDKLKIQTVLDAGAVQLGIKSPGFWSWTGKPEYYIFDEVLNDWQRIASYITECADGSTGSDCLGVAGSAAGKRTFSFRAIPWFQSARDAIAVVTFSSTSFWSGETSYETKIVESSDGGRSWVLTERELPESYCSQIVPEIQDRLLVSCEGVSSDFYESTDRGESWEQTRFHENY